MNDVIESKLYENKDQNWREFKKNNDEMLKDFANFVFFLYVRN